MKSSASPWVLAISLAAASLLVPVLAVAQDTLVLTNGQSREGQILRVEGGRVHYKAGPSETSLPLDQIRSVTMAPPAAFESVLEKWKADDAAGTLKELRPLLQKFQGLPTPWVVRASALLGGVLLATGDTQGAEKAFADFQTTYPNAKSLAEIGLARLAVEKGDLDAAIATLEPIVEAARKTLLAESGKSAEYGQATYLMGRALEGQGKLSEALESYLLTTTVFYEDPTVVARAQERARVLEKEKNVTVP